MSEGASLEAALLAAEVLTAEVLTAEVLTVEEGQDLHDPDLAHRRAHGLQPRTR